MVPKLIGLLPMISLSLALSSVLWLLVLPMEGNYRKTYISENALMPSQVTSYFRESEWNIVRGYRSELKKLQNLPTDELNHIVEEWLTDSGLKTSYHHGDSSSLYAIMHASRGEDTEAMVLTIPWKTSDGQFNLGGASIGLALGKYFNRMSIWSKNIILVFTEDSHKSLRQWVEAYHTSLDKTAGSIEAAIILEYNGESDHFDYIEMWYEGLNGQLPNLDFLNTAAQIAYHENIHVSVQNTPGEKVTLNTYQQRLKVFVKGIIGLCLSGIVKPINGAESFSGWSIQAVTLKARGIKGPNDITQMGRVVDSTFRSVNNLLEKFHQSFFFYLLLSPRFFVSIGTYLPSAILIAVSYALSSLSCLLNSNISIASFLNSISKVLIIFTSIEFACFLAANTLPFLIFRTITDEDKNNLITLIIVGFSLLNVVLSTPFLWKTKYFRISSKLSYSLISFSLFFISMVITMLLILNFSLALLIGLVSLPLTFIQSILKSIDIQPSQSIESFPLLAHLNNLKPYLKLFICLFVSNPIFIIIVTGSSYLGDNGVYNLMTNLITSWNDLQCWTWYIVMLGWFPAWLTISFACLFGKFDFITSTKKIQ